VEGHAIGLVELLAAQPHHFNEDDVLFLNDVAVVALELNDLKASADNPEEHAADLEADLLAKFDVKDLMSALEQDRTDESEAATEPEINHAALMEPLESFIRNGNAVPAVIPVAKLQVATVITHVAPKPRTAKEESTKSRRQMVWLL